MAFPLFLLVSLDIQIVMASEAKQCGKKKEWIASSLRCSQ